MNLNCLPKSKKLLETAFRRARKESGRMKRVRDHAKNEKSVGIRRIEVSANHVIGLLEKAGQEFPKIKEMSPFYRELVPETIDLDKTLKALGHFKATRSLARRLKGKHIGLIKGLERKEAHKAKGIARQFYGRLGSIVKKLDASIEAYNRTAKKLRELPRIKQGMPTAIIAGYPNTGKTTILGRLTKSPAKVASYAFTTQKLQVGYLEKGYSKFQLVDTPGLLDKPSGKRNRIEKKGIAALKHLANAVIFVVDPTERCGFSLEKQAGLLEEIRRDFKVEVIVVLNKADIASQEEMEKAGKVLGKAVEAGKGNEGKNVIVEGKSLESGLKGRVEELLK